MKKEAEDLDDLLVSHVKFYGKEIDFFFIAASMTRIDEPSEKDPVRMDLELVRLNHEEI